MSSNYYLSEKPQPAMERGSMSRSTRVAKSMSVLDDGLSADDAATGHRPALLWTAPAERSDDGALALPRIPMEPLSSGASRSQDPKRRGASLPAALQNAGRDDFAIHANPTALPRA
jgi:hypothetical protein